MTVPGNLSSPLLATAAEAAAAAAGPIKSLRFNEADSAYLHRTPSSAGSRTTWTWSCWFKRGKNSNYSQLFNATTASNNYTQIYVESDGTFVIAANTSAGGNRYLVSTRLLRDPSAWYHLVAVFDTTNSTQADRMRLYVNNERVTDFSLSSLIGQNVESNINSTNQHSIGSIQPYGTSGRLDGYLADVYFIDGSALDPTSFGAYDDNGVWQSAAYSGTFGTNGFHLLDFANESTIGHDSSGNENDFTAVNFSTTAGAGNDVLFDVPTNGTQSDTGAGGEVSGNYCVLNPLASGGTLSNGNLDGSCPVNSTQHATFAIPASGKWYFEAEMTNSGILNFGLAAHRPSGHIYQNPNSVVYSTSGVKNVDAVTDQSYGASWTTGDIIGCACDADAGTITFYKNNSSQGALSHQIAGLFPSFGNGGQSTNYTVNFGQRAFEYSAPSGFKALCTTNLPTPTIADGSDYFDIQLYTGNGASTPSGSGSTQDFSNFAFAPSFVWIKDRTQSGHNHNLVDIVRGAPNLLLSDATNAEITNSTDGFTGFTSDGFTLGDNGEGTQSLELNKSGNAYVAWAWNGGSSTVSNTDGSITSSVRANQTAGFSIVTYTSTGVNNATVGHGLGSTPHMIWTKSRGDGTRGWGFYHRDVSVSGDKTLILNTDVAQQGPDDLFNGVSSTTFTLGADPWTNYYIAQNMVAYCFAPIASYSAVGSWTGNGSSDGPFVALSFRPAFILWKRKDSAQNWAIIDNSRSTFNVADDWLGPNSSDAESSNNAAYAIDMLSNGFKVRATHVATNASGGTYIYYAVAENPFQANGGLAR